MGTTMPKLLHILCCILLTFLWVNLNASELAAPPVTSIVKEKDSCKLADPQVRLLLIQKIKLAATLDPVHTSAMHDAIFTFLAAEKMALQKTLPHLERGKLNKAFAQLLRGTAAQDFTGTDADDLILLNFWQNYLHQTKNQALIAPLVTIEKQHTILIQAQLHLPGNQQKKKGLHAPFSIVAISPLV